MTDPFRDVDAASAETIAIIADALEARAADPSMLPMVDAYLDAMDVPAGSVIVDIGSGTGGVTRRIADRFPHAEVLGLEPSSALVGKAEALAGDRPNLSFAVGDGAALGLEDCSTDFAILHTVLSHVTEPALLLAEAARILKPGGVVVLFDADFSKAAMGSVPGDPLGSCAEAFVAGAVTDPWLTGKLKQMVRTAGFAVTRFDVSNRVVTEGMGSLVWVRMSSARLVSEGVIGQPLADALQAEYVRRAEAGTLYAILPFATLIASRPAA